MSRKHVLAAFTLFLLPLVILAIIGVLFGDRGPSSYSPALRPVTREATGRRMSHPSITGDPYVRKALEDNILALETRCRESGDYCHEATEGRAALKRLSK